MTTRTDWNPLKELLSVQKRMNDLFDSAMARTNFDAHEGLGSWIPVCDVFETPRELVVLLELPGLERDEIDVKLEGDELVVSGQRKPEGLNPGDEHHRLERSYGAFSRRCRVPSNVDRGAVQAAFRNGLLRVTLPIRDTAEHEARRVSVD
jgi:HSP20 family protein